MFLIGVPWREAGTAGGLFGTKLVLNEFVAFIDLGKMDAATLSQRSREIVTQIHPVVVLQIFEMLVEVGTD